MIDAYSEPYCIDRNKKRGGGGGGGGGVLVYIREDIPSKLLADHKLPHEIE